MENLRSKKKENFPAPREKPELAMGGRLPLFKGTDVSKYYDERPLGEREKLIGGGAK